MSEPLGYASAQLNEPPNKVAVWAMVVGIVALVLSPVVVGGVLGLVAFIMGIVGLNRSGRRKAAVTGMVTGACAMPAAFFWLVMWVAIEVAPHGMPKVRRAELELMITKTALDAFEVDNGAIQRR